MTTVHSLNKDSQTALENLNRLTRGSRGKFDTDGLTVFFNTINKGEFGGKILVKSETTKRELIRFDDYLNNLITDKNKSKNGENYKSWKTFTDIWNTRKYEIPELNDVMFEHLRNSVKDLEEKLTEEKSEKETKKIQLNLNTIVEREKSFTQNTAKHPNVGDIFRNVAPPKPSLATRLINQFKFWEKQNPESTLENNQL